MQDPILKFKGWWHEALTGSPLHQKSAVCVSTITKEGFPSGRFVDLKAADDSGFTFCTTLDSNKGKEIAVNPKVALTVWWDHMGYQVRITGNAVLISEIDALKYWSDRSRDAQLATAACNQSRPLESDEALAGELKKLESRYRDRPVPKPGNWGGYKVKPVSIEFLDFKENRLHKRELFEYTGEGLWNLARLQP